MEIIVDRGVLLQVVYSMRIQISVIHTKIQKCFGLFLKRNWKSIVKNIKR